MTGRLLDYRSAVLAASGGGRPAGVAGAMMTSRVARPTPPYPAVSAGLCTTLIRQATSRPARNNVAKWRRVEELRSPEVSSAVLPREVPSAVQAAAAALAEAPCFDQDVPSVKLSAGDDDEVKLDKLMGWLEALLPGSEHTHLRTTLAEDALGCCSIYESAHGLSTAEEHRENKVPQSTHRHHTRLRVKLELVDRPWCTRFHIDNLRVRLLRVYFGPTTEVLDKAGVDWEAFEAKRGNKAVVSDPGKVMQMPQGSVILLKGRHFHPGQERTGCIHRSPSLNAPGWLYNSRGQPRRMLLTVDDMTMNNQD